MLKEKSIKPRKMFSLSEETLRKFDEIFESELSNYQGDGRFYESYVIEKLINDRYEILQKTGE